MLYCCGMCCVLVYHKLLFVLQFPQRVSSENVRFSRLLTHQSLLRATKGDVDDIETSLLSQVVAKQQLEILEEEEKQQDVIEQEQTKVKRKEMKWEPKQLEVDKEAKITPTEEIHKERQQEERRKLEGDKISGSKRTVTVEVQDSSNLVTEDTTVTNKQQQKKSDDKQPATTAPATTAPTVLFKQLKNQYQSISEKLKEQEERELARRATLESRKKDAAQIRAARQSQKRTDVVTTNGKSEEREECNEIVIQLDQMGSYAAFNDNDRHDNATMATQHKRHTESIKSSVGDDEYYQQMTNNTTHIIASKAT